ncbi:MAG: ion transporter [Bacteroidota bacterium]
MKHSYEKFRESVRELFDGTSFAAKFISRFIIVLIVASTLAIIVESLPWFRDNMEKEFYLFEVFVVAVFTVEYVFRIWSAKHPFQHALRFMSIVDLLAILPFYLGGLDFRALRILRALRAIRVVKLARYSAALRTLGQAFRESAIKITIFYAYVLVFILIASVIMYETEPQVFNNVPHAMWWAIVTITTVGYGDVYPTSPLGQFIGSLIMLLGIGIIAVPTGIISAHLTKEVLERRRIVCPKCGHDNHDDDAKYCKMCGERLKQPSTDKAIAQFDSPDIC